MIFRGTWHGDPRVLQCDEKFEFWSRRGRGARSEDKASKRDRKPTEAYLKARQDMADTFAAQRVAKGKMFVEPVTITIKVWWPSVHRQGELIGEPCGNAGDCMTAVREALGLALVLPHPHAARIETAQNYYDRDSRIDVEVKPWGVE